MSSIFAFFSNFGKSTFRPIKHVSPNHRAFNAFETLKATLGSENLEASVKCPPGRDVNDWLSMNTLEFYNELNLFYSIVEDKCTTESCPHMSAGNYQYYWEDSAQYKKPTDLPAHKYMELLVDWITQLLNNPDIFPDDPIIPYPPDFLKIVSKIFRRMFRIYAHIYFHHKDSLKKIGGMGHLNTSFRHFIAFVKQYNLMDPKEFAPLQPIIDQF
ncbi:MOB kinase activator-like 1A [Histomonas meleagridis]|uniref:MOB kinase activator-like 1A n=1 Tax=Histomonas meleagridis TaxID=135588 RepID=UPI003559E9C7|nr:MOB kinase activator-like 1A [Histomonas meleagridis]KAH0799404.1 MOB kinase activator-like 1A [Histomonas meleagridis]